MDISTSSQMKLAVFWLGAITCFGLADGSMDADSKGDKLQVGRAIELEANSLATERNRVLKETFSKRPNLSIAGWCLGFLQEDGKWLTVDQIADQTRLNEHYREFVSRLHGRGSNAGGFLALAKQLRHDGQLAESEYSLKVAAHVNPRLTTWKSRISQLTSLARPASWFTTIRRFREAPRPCPGTPAFAAK